MENAVSGENNYSGTGRYPLRGSLHKQQTARPVHHARQAQERTRYQEIDTEGRPATCLVWFD